MPVSTEDAIAGALLGTAVGDALGLPYEGLSARRARRLLGEPVRHRFLLGRGMVSDDTEHACMVVQALAAAGGRDVDVFCRRLAWALRWWILGLPAGVGLATLRASLKLWAGFPPDLSGVFSAGNGPAMRSAVIGAALDDRDAVCDFVRASTRLTHTDPRAYHGALAVALAAQLARRVELPNAGALIALCEPDLHEHGPALLDVLHRMAESVARGEQTQAFAASLGLERGVSGYVLHTVPVAVHAWLSHPGDYREAVMAVIRCGGDADTTAAIVGGIAGAGVGPGGIPREWLERLVEWPRSVAWMRGLAGVAADAVARGAPVPPPRLFAPFVLGRNLLFLVVVLAHGVRRLLPPY